MICEKIIRKKVYCLNLHRKLKIDEDIDKGENLLVESHWLEYIYIYIKTHTHTLLVRIQKMWEMLATCLEYKSLWCKELEKKTYMSLQQHSPHCQLRGE